jgi:hypothetical protein
VSAGAKLLENEPMQLALNVLLFQAGWFACVLGAALAVIGLGWAILAPALLGAARRLDGCARP